MQSVNFEPNSIKTNLDENTFIEVEEKVITDIQEPNFKLQPIDNENPLTFVKLNRMNSNSIQTNSSDANNVKIKIQRSDISQLKINRKWIRPIKYGKKIKKPLKISFPFTYKGSRKNIKMKPISISNVGKGDSILNFIEKINSHCKGEKCNLPSVFFL